MNDGSPNTRLAGNTPNPTATGAGNVPLPGSGSGSPRPAVLSLAIKDKAALYAAYMPYLKNGGIFVPTTRVYQLGDEVYLILTLMEDPTKIPVAGKVVWMSPAGGGARQPGIGVHFPADESGMNARRRIEEILGAALKSARPTHTL